MCHATKLTVTAGDRPQFEEGLVDGRLVTVNCGGETRSCSTRRVPAGGLNKDLTANAAVRQIFNLDALSSLRGDVTLDFLFNKMESVHFGSWTGLVLLQKKNPQMLLCVHSCQVVHQQFKIQTTHSSDLTEVCLLNLVLLVALLLPLLLFHVCIFKSQR